MNLDDIRIYRMIHIKNIPHILQNGITHKNSANRNPDFITIGDVSLIATRSSKQVSVNNGDFIPFYFGVKMPMLYVMQNGGNFVEKATPPEEIIYLACSVRNIIGLNKEYYFSDGHGTDDYTTFYDKSGIDKLPKIIDWPSVKASYWGGQENLNTKRKKQAEFLLAGNLPPEFIIGFGCYNELAKDSLMKMGVQEAMIKIIPNAYY